MPYFSPFKQENIMNSLLDAYDSAQKIRQRRNDEEMLKSVWNNDPRIQQNFDKDETLLGRLFGTGLRTIPKEKKVIPYNVPNTFSREEINLPVNKLEITADTPKESITKTLLSKSSAKKAPVKKDVENGSSIINAPSLLDSLDGQRNVSFRSTPSGIESSYPISTEQMVSEISPKKENYFTPGLSLLANLYGG